MNRATREICGDQEKAHGDVEKGQLSELCCRRLWIPSLQLARPRPLRRLLAEVIQQTGGYSRDADTFLFVEICSFRSVSLVLCKSVQTA